VATARPKPARPRGRPPLLARESIVAAAMELDLANFTMQEVAQRLGVTTQALYRWVQDRDELLDLVADTIVERVTPPPLRDDKDWKEWLTEFAQALRAELLGVPGIAARGLTRYHVSPGFLRLQERVLEALIHGGMRPERGVHAWAIFGTSVLAWIAREQSLAMQRATGRHIEEEIRLARASSNEELPLVSKFGTTFTDTSPDERFAILLDALIAGIAVMR
jgi:AcrR family transcriptional regulator